MIYKSQFHKIDPYFIIIIIVWFWVTYCRLFCCWLDQLWVSAASDLDN